MKKTHKIESILRIVISLILAIAIVTGSRPAHANQPRHVRVYDRILDELTVWHRPDGTPVYAKFCREMPRGCERYVWQTLVHMMHYADYYGPDVELIAAIALHETRFNRYAIGPIGEVGIMQLNPRARWGKEAIAHCSRYIINCHREQIRIAVRTLTGTIESCGWDVPLALGRYNTGRCMVNRYSKKVQEIYKRLKR